jgi:hypothetical protein
MGGPQEVDADNFFVFNNTADQDLFISSHSCDISAPFHVFSFISVLCLLVC